MLSDKPDYYDVLGVGRDATKDEIRTAYRRLARQYHPDTSEEPDAEARIKEINEAYEILRGDKKRQQYDRFGHAGVGQGQADFSGFGGFGDIFEDFFGFGMRGPAGPRPSRGADLRYDLEISFEDAVFGAEREIEINALEMCPNCGGSGAEPGTSPVRCPECGGSGQVRRTQQSIFGSFVNVSTCPRCGGRGEVISTPCSVCHGEQRIEKTRRIRVDIPAGVDDGTRIRLSGEGEAGLHGGPAGNLYIFLHVRPHAYFHRRDDDIMLNININIVQASLGTEVMVPTLEGEEKLAVPPGTQTGTIFRLRGKGAPRLRRSGRGDQIIVANVAVPTHLDSNQKRLLTELGKSLGTELVTQEGKGVLERLKETLGL